MKLHILVEGESEAALLRPWLRRFLPRHVCKVYPHQGKGRLSADPDKIPDPVSEQLLTQLPAKLKAYGRDLSPDTDRVLVLVDLDENNCLDLKRRLVKLLDICNPKPEVLFRFAIEETEAFYLGDPEAIKRAFPQAKIRKLRSYEPDSICGAWEFFMEVIGAKEDDKVGWAQAMAPELGLQWKGRNANRSPSFQHLCQALLRLAGEPLD